MKRLYTLIISLLIVFSVNSSASNFYGFTDLTGGTTGCLDKIVNPNNGDMAMGSVAGTTYSYKFNSSCVQSSNPPTYIVPVTGTGCWEYSVFYSSTSSTTATTATSATNANSSLAALTATVATTANVALAANALSFQYVDWNASSGANSIANKPTIGTLSSLGAGTMVNGDICTYNSGTNAEDCNLNMTVFQVATANIVTGTGTQYRIPVWGAANTLSQIAGVGSANYVLTSHGNGFPPTFEANTGVGGNVTMTYPDAGVAVSAGAYWDTSINATTLVRTTTTVNGYALSANVVINATDVSLGNVTNVAQIEKIASATNGDIVVWSGTTGANVADSGYTVASFAPAFTSGTANYFWATPSGSSGVPTLRAIISADLPATIGANTTGTASNLSGTPTLPNGTKATTQSAGDNSTNLATTAYVHSAVTVSSPSLSYYTNSLTSNVSLSNTSTYYTGPTVAQGTTGVWYASGSVSVYDTDNGSGTFYVKLWDGTTVIDSAKGVANGGSSVVTFHLSGIISSPAGNIRISVRDISTSTGGKISYNSSGLGKDSTVSAIRIQ